MPARPPSTRPSSRNATCSSSIMGFFLGRPLAISGTHYQRIKRLLDGDCALYAAHLPLDAHPELGNNAQIARLLGLEALEAFDSYKGKAIGFKGQLPKPEAIDEIILRLGSARPLERLDFGSQQVRSIGIVSGAAADDLDQAIDENLDLYITGEASHITYHQALEAHINILCLGHYFTETFGVRAVGRMLGEKLGLECIFIDLPTGL